MDYSQLVNKNVMQLDLIPYLKEWEARSGNIEKMALTKKQCVSIKSSFEERLNSIHSKHKVINNNADLNIDDTRSKLGIALINAQNNRVEKDRQEKNIIFFYILRVLDNITSPLRKIFR